MHFWSGEGGNERQTDEPERTLGRSMRTLELCARLKGRTGPAVTDSGERVCRKRGGKVREENSAKSAAEEFCFRFLGWGWAAGFRSGEVHRGGACGGRPPGGRRSMARGALGRGRSDVMRVGVVKLARARCRNRKRRGPRRELVLESVFP